MAFTRRQVISHLGGAALGSTVFAPAVLRRGAALAQIAAAGAPPVHRLPVVDASETKRFRLTADGGTTEFVPGVPSETLGFNQAYLGPVVILKSGTQVEARVENRTQGTITTHWHGLLVPGEVDGGPHNLIEPGADWRPILPVDQAPATLWYHSHVHHETAETVYAGLAGALIATDGKDAERGLPSRHDVDDLVLIIQDKRIDRSGRAVYQPSMPDVMHGFLGNAIAVNGTIGGVVTVGSGLVRLRLVNASNARNYTLSFDDRRSFHLIASDQGLLVAPVEATDLRLTPGERVEILVNFAEHGAARLVSQPHVEGGNSAGMMGGMMGAVPESFTGPFTIADFAVDPDLPAGRTAVPTSLESSDWPATAPVGVRSFLLNDMPMGMGMGMGGGMMGRGQGIEDGADLFGINGAPFRMDRIDFRAKAGTLERWIVSGQAMGHPLHVHGVQFKVLSENGRPPRPENSGIKDTAFIDGTAELLVRFGPPATTANPFMFHCHILEHEDAGLMGQFAVG